MSSESKYDSVMWGEVVYMDLELYGKYIFFDFLEDLLDGECGYCYILFLFMDQIYMNNGL